MTLAANTSESAPQKSIQPTKTEVFLGRIQRTATALVAGLGLVTSAEAQPEKTNTANTILPFSGPVLTTTTPSYVAQLHTIPGVNTRLVTTRGTVDTPVVGTSRFTVTVPTAGTLTISWDAIIGNGDAPDDTNGSSGYMGANQSYDVNGRFQFGLVGGPMSDIQIFDDGVTHPNTVFNEISAAESFHFGPQHFSKNITINTPGTYAFDAQIESINAAGFGDTSNLSFTLDNIPEPATTTLLSGALAALLLRRKRESQ